MAVMRNYYAVALKAPLAAWCDEVRTLPLSKRSGARRVGVDMPCENLNRALKRDIHDPSVESVTEYCEHAEFTTTVAEGVERLMYASRGEYNDDAHKSIDDDVRILKAWLRRKIGATWAEATRVNQVSELGITERAVPPWVAMVQAQHGIGSDHYLTWVKGHVKDKAPWHVWRREPGPSSALPPLYQIVD